jgi:CRISPR-associated protein Cmr1
MMPNLKTRFYKRKSLPLECEVVTPMFLGNAAGAAQWRSEPFKALFRYWWRVTQHNTANKNLLFNEEKTLFGTAGDEKTSCKSLFTIEVSSTAPSNKRSLKELPKLSHEECERLHNKVDPLHYLAGMGLLEKYNKVKAGRSYFPSGASFTVKLGYTGGMDKDVNRVLAIVQAFGAIGGRCRNGWGSFQIKHPVVAPAAAEKVLAEVTVDWKDGFGRDYPNTLGKDDKGNLLWKTEPEESWEEAMAKLAEAYIAVRAHAVGGDQKLDPGASVSPEGDVKKYLYQERHLLGIPLTSHPRAGGSLRHASPLRFVVKKQPSRFLGFILHVPHSHSQDQKLAPGVDQQKVWEKVHRKLDGLAYLSRSSYSEVL